jgi:hypothetical protein
MERPWNLAPRFQDTRHMNVGMLLVLRTSLINPTPPPKKYSLLQEYLLPPVVQDLCILIVKITNTAQRQTTARSREAVLSWCFHSFFPRTRSEELCSPFLLFKCGKTDKFQNLSASKSIYCWPAPTTIYLWLKLITNKITYTSKVARMPFANWSLALVFSS